MSYPLNLTVNKGEDMVGPDKTLDQKQGSPVVSAEERKKARQDALELAKRILS